MKNRKTTSDAKPIAARNRVSDVSVVEIAELSHYLDQAMNVASIKDYCPNGLQVEGKQQISRLAIAVTASLKAIEAACAWQADALLVHHGLFWKSDSQALVGPLGRRVRKLMFHDLNLLAYHLPLDVHGKWGNNWSLGKQLGFAKAYPLGKDGLIWACDAQPALTAEGLQQRIEGALNRKAVVVGDLQRSIKKIAWCTGGAQGYLADAIALGADAFISGEISEQTTHLAREAGVVFIAAGHHATERYGVQALGAHLKKRYQLTVQFFDDDNPA